MNTDNLPAPQDDQHPALRPEEPQIEIISPPQTTQRLPLAPMPPLHIFSSLVTLALDWVWFMVELPASVSIAFLPALLPLSLVLGAIDFAAVTVVQHFLADEPWGKAAAKGLVMGILAAVPYPVFGTIIGAPLAAWAGVREVQKLLPGHREE
jgi:hypothetical protein